MDAVPDFEDLLDLLDRHDVRYLIVGGLAFIYHAKPRYTKDMDLWIDPAPDNVQRANTALVEFGSPNLMRAGGLDEILQLGAAPNRIDIIQDVEGPGFAVAWKARIEARYGQAKANWIDLDSLIDIKGRIDDPRHQDDARILREVRRRQRQSDARE